MPKDERTQALLIHAVAYAVVVAICAGVNLWLAPENLWFVWVALGWGIGLGAHALAYWLRHTRRRERVFIDPKARGATVHLFAYVAVVVLLFVVNLIVTPKVWWFYWVALGWGAGVAFHVWCAFFKTHGPGEDRRRLGRGRLGRLRHRVRGEAEPSAPSAPAKKAARRKSAAKKATPKKVAPKKKTARKRSSAKKTPKTAPKRKPAAD